MKEHTLYLLLLPLLFSGCAQLNYSVKNKFDPMVGVAKLGEVRAALADTQTPEPGHECQSPDMVYYQFGNCVKEKEQVKTVYSKGNFLAEASSLSETQTARVWDGTCYEFIFDKAYGVLRYYLHETYNNNRREERTPGGNEELAKDYHQDRTAWECKQLAPGKAGPATAGTLEQKLNDLKNLKDNKTITDEEYARMRENILNNYTGAAESPARR